MDTNPKPTQNSGPLIERVASAFLRRDWATATVELVLIVVGILIAIEVDRWNTARIERGQESFYVEWIASSLDRSISLGERSIASGEKSISSATWVYDKIHSCDLPDDEAALFAERLVSIGPWA